MAVFTRESPEVEEGGAAPGGDIAIAEEVGRSAESCWVIAFVTEETNVEIKSGDKDGDVVVEGAPELTTLDVLCGQSPSVDPSEVQPVGLVSCSAAQ